MKQLDLLTPRVHDGRTIGYEPTGLSRRSDPDTSHAAADAIAPKLNEIHRKVLAAYRQHGPMSARTAERLERFREYGFSTIRKRISELASVKYGEQLVVVRTEKSGRTPASVYAPRESA